jgi:hypothetical protein
VYADLIVLDKFLTIYLFFSLVPLLDLDPDPFLTIHLFFGLVSLLDWIKFCSPNIHPVPGMPIECGSDLVPDPKH